MIQKKVYLNANLEIKGTSSTEDDPSILKIGGFANHASKDRSNEVIVPDAWKKGVVNYKKNPVVLFNHDMSKPIGKVTNIVISEEGLYIEANISSAAEKLYGTQTLIRDGALKSFSVGFLPKKGRKDTATDTIFITELELVENSVVAVPMNQNSLFSVIKSMDESDRTKFLESLEEFDSTKELKVETEIQETAVEKVVQQKLVEVIKEKPITDENLKDLTFNVGDKLSIDSKFWIVSSHKGHDVEMQEVTLLGNPINNILKIDDRSLVMLNLNQVKNSTYSSYKTVEKRSNAEIEKLFGNIKSVGKEYTQYFTYLTEKAIKDWNSDDYVVANKIIELYRVSEKEHVEEKPMSNTEVTNTVETPITAVSAAVAEPKVLELVPAVTKAQDALEIARESGESATKLKALEDKLEAVLAELTTNKDKLAAAQNEKVAYAAAQTNGNSLYTAKDLTIAALMAYGRNASTGREFSMETFANSSKLGKSILQTGLSTKATITTVDALITEYTSSIMKQMEIELKVAPMLKTLDIVGQHFKVPVADEDTNGDIAMFANGTYNVGETDSTRVPTTRQNTITAVDLTPHKFMGTTHLAKDEQEDVLIPLLQFQVDALTRRMARAIDKSLLRGDGSLTGFTASPTNAITPGTGYASVIKGICPLAADASLLIASGGNSTKATPAKIAAARAQLGRYGLDNSAGNLVYFTSIEGYNDLVTTADFQTIDKFGDRATYITGQVGAIYGIPVVVTEFLDVVGVQYNHIGVLVWLPGFIVGRRRAVEVETQYDPRRQLNIVYLSTRFDFKAMTTVANAALNTTGYSFASLIRSTA